LRACGLSGGLSCGILWCEASGVADDVVGCCSSSSGLQQLAYRAERLDKKTTKKTQALAQYGLPEFLYLFNLLLFFTAKNVDLISTVDPIMTVDLVDRGSDQHCGCDRHSVKGI